MFILAYILLITPSILFISTAKKLKCNFFAHFKIIWFKYCVVRGLLVFIVQGLTKFCLRVIESANLPKTPINFILKINSTAQVLFINSCQDESIISAGIACPPIGAVTILFCISTIPLCLSFAVIAHTFWVWTFRTGEPLN